jgi:hypothetical protein
MRFATLILLFPLALSAQLNTTLSPKAAAAFDNYVRQAEPKISNTPHYSQIRAGEVRIDPTGSEGTMNVKDGLVHDWVAGAVVPGATVEQALAVLRTKRCIGLRLSIRACLNTMAISGTSI